MIDSTMHCKCGKYEERKVATHGYRGFDLDYAKMSVCKNCGLLPPIKTPGLFIHGDTYKGDDK